MPLKGFRLSAFGFRALLGIVLALAGCGGGGSSAGSATGAVQSGIGAGGPGGFTASSIDPADAASAVPHGSPVRLSFSGGAPEPSTITDASFFITRAGSPTHVSGRIAVGSSDAT